MTQIQRKINWIKMHALQEAQKPVSNAFVTTWNMTSGEFTLLTQEGTYNATIDWGDGQTSTHTTGNPTHTYAKAGQYQIKITGQYNGLRINRDATQKDKLIAVNAWGNVGFTSFSHAYHDCSNLASLPNGSITGAEAVEDFLSAFGDTSIATLPTDLFKYTINAKSFMYCFAGSKVATIPIDLFKYTVSVESFYGCFFYCKNIALPTSIFDLSALQAKQPNMGHCFFVSSTADSPTGTIQPIWNYVTITANNGCFGNCTALSNYSQIPELWR